METTHERTDSMPSSAGSIIVTGVPGAPVSIDVTDADTFEAICQCVEAENRTTIEGSSFGAFDTVRISGVVFTGPFYAKESN